MAQKNENDLLIDDDLVSGFLGGDDEIVDEQVEEAEEEEIQPQPEPKNQEENTWEEEEDFPGQLAVDVFETPEKLIIKARTAGVDKKELDVSISEGILTISGTLSSGDEENVTAYHIMECYWGEFTRTLALPIPVKEDEVEAVLKDGVLTISFEKIQQQIPVKIPVVSDL